MLIFVNKNNFSLVEADDSIRIEANIDENSKLELKLFIPWTKKEYVDLIVKTRSEKIQFFSFSHRSPISLREVCMRMKEEKWNLDATSLLRIIDVAEKAFAQDNDYEPVLEVWLLKNLGIYS